MEIWQLTEEAAKKIYSLAYPNNQQSISIDPSTSQLRIFTLDLDGIEQNEITIYKDGLISYGSTSETPLPQEKDKVTEFLKRLEVEGF